jgi:8-oxo-dGTP pyrophosphatase MutT (NUDIX family)
MFITTDITRIRNSMSKKLQYGSTNYNMFNYRCGSRGWKTYKKNYCQRDNHKNEISTVNDLYGVSKAGCVIFDLEMDHLVLVKNRMSFEKNENKFGLPKGGVHISLNETFRDAAEREVYEEIGLKLSISTNCKSIKICDIIYYIISIDKTKHPVFLPKDNLEILAAEWIPVKDIKNLNLNRSLSRLVRRWDKVF